MPLWKLKGMSATPAFHGSIGKRDAELKLKKKGGHCHLLRYNKAKDVYRLSVMKTDTITKTELIGHFTVIILHTEGDTEYQIYGAEEKFGSIQKMLEFYKTTPLNYQFLGIGDPVIREGTTGDTSTFKEPPTNDSGCGGKEPHMNASENAVSTHVEHSPVKVRMTYARKPCNSVRV